MKRTKIICTIGPACDDPKTLQKLMDGGANIFRLNFSHGSHEEHGKRIADIKALREKTGQAVGILLDTKGPEIRIGKFENGPIELIEGDQFTLTTREVMGNEKIVSVNYKDFAKYISKDTQILIDDGLVALKAVKVEGEDIQCTVLNGGTLSDRKGVNVPDVVIDIPFISEKDRSDILFGIEQGVDFIAASFVRTAKDVLELRRLLQTNGGRDIQIISKIENRQAVACFDEIVKVSDAIMIARGDLGVEIPIENVPIVQKEIIATCRALGRPSITATQMLDSMVRNPRPTRAEVNDVANAVYDGCDAVMLSGETASGKYPVEALKTMARIVKHVEANITPMERIRPKHIEEHKSVTDAVSHACCQSASDLNAAAILTSTSSGYTARKVAKYRPECPIIATTHNPNCLNKLTLIWGVMPIQVEKYKNTDDMINHSVNSVREKGLVKDGDVVVITAGIPVGVSGTTNLIKVHVVGDVLVRGTGIGIGTVHGRACVVQTVEEVMQCFQEGDILVVPKTDNTFLPYMKKAGAIICEDDDASGHTASVGLALEKPVIYGAEQATEAIPNGAYITVDTDRGQVLNSQI